MRHISSVRLTAAGVALGLVSAFVLPASPAQADGVRSQQWYLDFLGVAQAHQYSQGAGVTVGLVDTGVDATHPDLVGGVLPGAALFPGATGDGRIDTFGHGTRMAGLIAGHGHGPDGSLGVLGIAPKATILPVRVGESVLGVGIVQGIEWATAHGAKVISLSLAQKLDDNGLRQAVEDAIAHDVVVVAGMGNTPAVAPQFPASYPGVLAVAGTDEHGDHGAFSVVGPQAVLAAPGADIVTTGLNHGYGSSSGTSDSTAIVAGAAALVRSKFPDLSAAEIIHRLTATAIDKGPPGRDGQYGYGIVNLVGALTADLPPLASGSPTFGPAQSSRARHPGGVAAGTWLLVALGILVAVAVVGVVVAVRRR